MNHTQTLYYKPRLLKSATLLIIDKSKKPVMIELNGRKTLGRDYEEAECDILLDSTIVSRNHGEFLYEDMEGSYYYIDHNSLNGTYLNGRKLDPYNERGVKAYKLHDGDLIRIDRSDLSEPHPEAVLIIFNTSYDRDEKWNTFLVEKQTKITIGRENRCSLIINDLMASREHAVMRKIYNNWYLEDCESKNGVSLNGNELLHECNLHKLDVFRIANTTVIFLGDRLLYNSYKENKISLFVDIDQKTVNFGKKVLLKNIHAEFQNGDFVLILGGSGSGKTTLIRAILGESKADGKIILNGQNLYNNFKNLKSQIGMVPQFLTLRKNDTVRNTLLDTAEMKLGKRYTSSEIACRVDEVIERVGIGEHQNKLIGQLSGGQQKKVSVANQLIGFQKVFICDEPDSGLDAASRRQQMEILKDISLEDKVVMVITHEPDDAVEKIGECQKSLFTKILVLARSSKDKAGHLAFFGGIDDALKYFNVDCLQDIMIEINPVAEGGKEKADLYIERYERLHGKINNWKL